MINIFNLFLFLCGFWAILAFVNGSFTLLFLIFGCVVALIISLISWKFKIINKNFNFLFLNLGFYYHFLSLLFVSFFYCVGFLIKSILFNQKEPNCLFFIQLNKGLGKTDLSLFIATLCFIPGISYIKSDENEIVIYAVSEKLFESLNLGKFYYNIHKINDDSLI